MIKAFVVLNPASGQGNSDERKSLFAEARSAGRWSYDLYETTGEEDLGEVVRRALDEDYNLVVACGGDGTVSEVVNGLGETSIPLGIVPGGTANALARELDIPNSVDDALQLILGEHRTRSIDLIRCGDLFFLMYCSVGSSAHSIRETSREQKNNLGWLAYIGTVIRALLGLKTRRFNLTVDGELEEIAAAEVFLFNSDNLGVVDQDLNSGIELNDGVLDLYAVRVDTLGEFLQMLINLLFKGRSAHIRYWPVKESVCIETQPPMAFQADGDPQGETPVEFEVAAAALQVIVPADGSE